MLLHAFIVMTGNGTITCRFAKLIYVHYSSMLATAAPRLAAALISKVTANRVIRRQSLQNLPVDVGHLQRVDPLVKVFSGDLTGFNGSFLQR